jgi:hypothetical protein
MGMVTVVITYCIAIVSAFDALEDATDLVDN